MRRPFLIALDVMKSAIQYILYCINARNYYYYYLSLLEVASSRLMENGSLLVLLKILSDNVFPNPWIILYDADVRDSFTLLNATLSAAKVCSRSTMTGVIVNGRECSAKEARIIA